MQYKFVLNNFSDSLTHYEKLEIFNYKEIYYFGLNIVKINPHPDANWEKKGENNWGYDDKKYLFHRKLFSFK